MNIDIISGDIPTVLKNIKNLEEHYNSSSDDLHVNFNPEWVNPLELLLYSSVFRRIDIKHPEINGTMDINESDACGYAAHIGFFKSISQSIDYGNEPGEAKGSSTYIPITHINFNELRKKSRDEGDYSELNDLIEAESKKLAKVLCRTNTNLQKLFSYIIREILRNTPEHSDSSIATMCAQNWKDGRAEIAILDEGIGIKNSLNKNPTHSTYIKSDLDALKCAIQPGISQAFSPDKKNNSSDVWSNSGFGLFMASEICKKLNGSFWIISGKKALLVNTHTIRSFDTLFNGTAIGIKIDTSYIRDTQNMINEIAKAGEERAKTIRNAFSRASKPSRNLVID